MDRVITACGNLKVDQESGHRNKLRNEAVTKKMDAADNRI